MARAAAGLGKLADAIRQTDRMFAAHAAKAVNVSLTLRNWFIGHYIAEFELQGAGRAAYGEALLPDLAKALRARKVSNTGRRQLYIYLAFYRAYPQIVRTASALSVVRAAGLVAPRPRLPSRKVRTASALSLSLPDLPAEMMLTRLSYSHFELLAEQQDPLKRRFYEIESLRGSWSVRELQRQLDTQLFERTGLSSNKQALLRSTHAQALPMDPASIIRDPYVWEFLGIKAREQMTETDLEEALLDKLQDFLLELGHGFCFEARQRRLLIGRKHYFVDLVFYHRVLKCHVLIELKNDAFKHEHLGQLGSYVSWYRENEMNSGDQPPIGILLCTAKDQELVEYALAGMTNKLFVSKYQVQLPDKAQITTFLQQAMRELAP